MRTREAAPGTPTAFTLFARSEGLNGAFLTAEFSVPDPQTRLQPQFEKPSSAKMGHL